MRGPQAPAPPVEMHPEPRQGGEAGRHQIVTQALKRCPGQRNLSPLGEATIEYQPENIRLGDNSHELVILHHR